MSGTMQEVDDLLAELNLTQPPRPKQTSVNEDEINSLMREIGIESEGKPRPVSSSGPGPAGKKISSGPGAMARGKISSGPGAKMVNGPPGLPAAQKFATHAPDGRPIQHQGPPCARCKEMIIGQCLNALGKQYHPEHFVCVHCNNPFPPGKQFIEHNGEPYCEADFTELFCPRCAVCKQPVADKAINALGHHYHPNHFNCTGCGRNLVGLVYKEDEGEPYCNSCKEARVRLITPAAEPCAKCKKPITGEFVVLKGQKMHAEHFRCEECGCEFKGGGCREYEGRLYCNDDYNKLLRNTCGSCHKPILGRSITALGRIWHPEHFVCYTCHEPFAGSNFYEKDGKPYCETHYTQEFGDPCAKCGRPVIHDALHFLDKVYHSDHFCCTGCEKQLKKGDINEWEGKPLCMKCFGKLPSEVRKKIEKKREADAKIAKQREKEEKAKAKAAGKK